MRVSFEINTRTVLRWTIGFLLVWAALSKLANPQDFLGSLGAYRLPLPRLMLGLAAIVLPWLELLCGLLLLANLLTDACLLWCVLLFTVFTVATGQAWIRGLGISCGCFDLRPFGLGDDGQLARLLHSPSVAFFRALALGTGSGILLRPQTKGVEGTTTESSLQGKGSLQGTSP